MSIKTDSLVSLAYELRFDDENGDIIETVDSSNPMVVRFGNDELLPDFEKHLEGLKIGDAFEFKLMPMQAYGEYDREAIVSVPKAELLEEAEETPDLEPGMLIPIATDDGEEMEAIVLEVEDDVITLDFNHPLAGESLYFKGSVLNVK